MIKIETTMILKENVQREGGQNYHPQDLQLHGLRLHQHLIWMFERSCSNIAI